MTPFDDFVYLINHVLLGEEPTIEDFILLVGTLVAFIAFILWCCFPIQPKEPGQHRQFTCKIIQNHIKAFDAATSTQNANDNAAAASATAATSSGGGGGSSGNASSNNTSSSGSSSNNMAANGGNIATSIANNNLSNNSSQYNGSYSKNGSVAMHNYYVKNGHHCCT